MTLTDRVTAPIVRPVLVGWLDFKDDPVYGWTGPGVFAPSGTGDTVLDGNSFSSAEGAVDVTDFREDMASGGGVSLTYSGHSENAPVFRQIVNDRREWLLRRAKIWLFFLQDDEKSVHPEFQQLFSGYMVAATFSRQEGAPASITLELDVDLRGAADGETRLIDHQRFYPGDGFSSYLLRLANGPIVGASRGASAPVMSGGGKTARDGDPRYFKAQ